MFNQIIAGILSFLLWIFPWSGTLLSLYQSASFPGESVVTKNIVDAINAGDIDAIEAMFSPDRKQTMDDLPGHIGALIDAIGGEVIEIRFNGAGYSSSESGTGRAYNYRSWARYLDTETETYILDIGWMITNSSAPREVGLGSLHLSDLQGNILAHTYYPK